MLNDPRPATIAALLAARAAELPGQSFLFLPDGETEGAELSFAALERRVAGVAAALRARLGAGERVLVMLAPGLDYTVAILACAVAGVIAVPVYPPEPGAAGATLAAVDGIVRDCAPALLLTEAAISDTLDRMDAAPASVTALPRVLFDDLPDHDGSPGRDAAAGNVCVLLYTSGSTGKPKGVALTQRNLIHAAWAMARDAGLGPHSVFCVWLPPYHISGLFSGIVLPLVAGGRMIGFPPRCFVERPARWVRAISKYRVTVTGSPTFAYDMVARATTPEQSAGLDLSCLDVAVIGGEAVRGEVIDRFAGRFRENGFRPGAFYTMFGLTEAAMISTGSGRGRGAAREWVDRDGLREGVARPVAPGHAAARASIASGFPLPETEVLAVDPNTNAVLPDRTVGEVWIGGPAVGAGYWGNEEATAAQFRARTADGRGPFLRTGDLAYTAGGQFHVVGRLKEMVIIRGLNFYPDDLDATVRQADKRLATARIASFAAELGGQEALAVAIELPEDAALDAAVRRGITAGHGIRVGALFHLPPGSIPVTGTGKVQRGRCAQLVAAGAWEAAGRVQTAEPDEMPLDRAAFRRLSPAGKREEALSVLRRMVARLADVPQDAVAEDDPLAGCGLDSIGSVSFALDVEDCFGIAVPAAGLRDGLTLGALADLCAGLTGSIAVPPVADRRLPADIRPGAAAAGRGNAVFLTGATGFLGGYLLHELLTRTDDPVCCLVRAASAEAGHRRLRDKLAAIGAWEERFAARIEAVPGDLGRPRFGLGEGAFSELAGRVGAIYHNGASVDFVASCAVLAPANVDATLDCLRLAVTGPVKPVHFTSTLAVFNGPDRTGLARIGEDDRLGDPDRLVGGYAQTKWVAESLLRQAAACGVPVGIYRAGFIGGHSRTGAWNADDFLCRMVKGSVQLGLFPDVAMAMPFVPVDAAARAIVALSQSSAEGASVHHLLGQEPLTLRRLMSKAAARGYALQAVPYDRWRLILREALPPDNSLFPLLPFLLEPGPDGETVVDLFVRHAQPGWADMATRARLAEIGGPPPPAVDGAYLGRCLGFLERTGFLPGPESAAPREAVPA